MAGGGTYERTNCNGHFARNDDDFNAGTVDEVERGCTRAAVRITDLLRMGMPIEQVQELLGHVKIETTRIYCTVTKEQVRASHRRFMAA